MRKPFIVGNWKMNLVFSEARDLVNRLRNEIENADDSINVGVCPAFVYLKDICEILKNSNVCVVAQNMYLESKGAFTGEVSGAMVKDVGCTHVIIGHSERRAIFKETNSMINAKIKSAFSHELNPILCVGEKLEEKEAGKTEDVVGLQISEGIDGLTPEQIEKLTIAYEPVWAIGTGKTASPEQANETHAFIRSMIGDRYEKGIAQGIRIQYGGSVNSKNARELLSQPEIDGALVGGASLDPESFLAIISDARELSQS